VQTVHVTLHNAGSRPALETVQVYVSDLVTSVTWAERELKAFAQARLKPGERREVEIALPVAECSIVDAAGHRHVEPGIFAVLVGPSSRDQDLLRAEFRVLP
jgi:beta-glucosidase